MVSSSFPGHTNWVLTSRYFLQRFIGWANFRGAGMGQITAVTKGDWMLETKHEPNLWTSKSDPEAKNYNWMEHFDPVCPCSQANRRTRVHWSHFDSASPILWSDLKLGDSRQESQPRAMVMRTTALDSGSSACVQAYSWWCQCSHMRRCQEIGGEIQLFFFCMFFFGRPGSLPWFLQLKFLTCCIL